MTTSPVDRIEGYFESWRHQIWGFVIYRCNYASDVDFAALITDLKTETVKNLEFYGANNRPIAQQLAWTIVEDREKLEGASKADVRDIFDRWCQSPEPAAEQPESMCPVAQSSNARYRFCIHVDQATIDSLKAFQRPWVNLVMRRWPYGYENDDEDSDEDDEDESTVLEEIEGSKAEDVGWCRVRNESLLPGRYSELCAPNVWYRFYERPPAVV